MDTPKTILRTPVSVNLEEVEETPCKGRGMEVPFLYLWGRKFCGSDCSPSLRECQKQSPCWKWGLLLRQCCWSVNLVFFEVGCSKARAELLLSSGRVTWLRDFIRPRRPFVKPSYLIARPTIISMVPLFKPLLSSQSRQHLSGAVRKPYRQLDSRYSNVQCEPRKTSKRFLEWYKEGLRQHPTSAPPTSLGFFGT